MQRGDLTVSVNIVEDGPALVIYVDGACNTNILFTKKNEKNQKENWDFSSERFNISFIYFNFSPKKKGCLRPSRGQ